MGLVHVKAGVEVSDLQGLKTKSQFNYWNPAWDTAVPGDAGAYAATAIADAMADLEGYQTILKTLSVGGAAGLMISEIRGFGGVTITATGEPHLYASDKLVLQIITQGGGLSKPMLPAPKSACFGGPVAADVMNQANAGVASLIAAITAGGVCDESGSLYKVVASGYLDGTRNRGKKPGGR